VELSFSFPSLSSHTPLHRLCFLLFSSACLRLSPLSLAHGEGSHATIVRSYSTLENRSKILIANREKEMDMDITLSTNGLSCSILIEICNSARTKEKKDVRSPLYCVGGRIEIYDLIRHYAWHTSLSFSPRSLSPHPHSPLKRRNENAQKTPPTTFLPTINT
jgi:hypothetical protein